MEDKVLENHKKFLERIEFYKKFGLDQIKEREFIFNKSLPIGGDILEIGTGKGHFCLALAKNGYRFTTIDIDKKEQKIARLNLTYYNLEDLVNFKIEDARHLSFPDKSFDVIFCVNVYHHLKTPSQVLEEMSRVLSLKGKIVLADFTKEGLDIINKCHEIEGRKHGHCGSNLETAGEFFSNRGFKIRQENSLAQELVVAGRG
ncbi:MAG: class I SAM-dependent methyltransferase [Candidatus Omnitrophica bacterium]|nr:class I SAM-dependent methyltransferase [Candidatus Omnitrophota bacterium]